MSKIRFIFKIYYLKKIIIGNEVEIASVLESVKSQLTFSRRFRKCENFENLQHYLSANFYLQYLPKMAALKQKL